MKKRSTVILIIIGLFFTIYRIYLSIKMPLFLQGDYINDDYLFVEYASEILKGNWLGNFGERTLVKSCSFSLFLVVHYLLKIPYSLALIIWYIIAILVFLFSIRKITNKSSYFYFIAYIVLLFSPVMFHIENVQKIYRGGTIVIFSILTMAMTIGLYANRFNKNKQMVKWAIFAGISLSFFWNLKEDSIWILPFILGMTFFTIIDLVKKRKINFYKIIITILPIIILIFSNFLYCSINYYKYGEFTITDRSGTYFKEVIADFLLIKDNEKKENIWITKKMMYKAVEASPTLKTIKPQIDDMFYEAQNFPSFYTKDGEIYGDLIFWRFRSRIAKTGIYDKGGKEVNQFYKKIHKELQQAFKEKRLEKSDGIYISKIMKSFGINEFGYFMNRTYQYKDVITVYSENETSINEFTGEEKNIDLMKKITNYHLLFKDKNNVNSEKKTIKKINSIVNIYRKLGLPLFITGLIGYFCFVILTLKDIKKKGENISLVLITSLMLFTGLVLLFGIEWFCSFLTVRDLYDYTCGLVPIIQFIEIVGCSYLITLIPKKCNLKTK